MNISYVSAKEKNYVEASTASPALATFATTQTFTAPIAAASLQMTSTTAKTMTTTTTSTA